ncbi:hypothetical protein B484DRAFT_455966 [Ochromonadaceae sp. CCMP2298]|nr:hypothetical protein B484DRAFT_455966 [Ochromonadaceae sp. CCMP2298]
MPPKSLPKSWKPPKDDSELVRLNGLIKFYEGANLDQQQKLETAGATYEANSKRIYDLEALKKTLQKNVKSLEGKAKFDKIASEGIKKKFNVAEFDMRELKAYKVLALVERAEHVSVIKQQQMDLNSNRADKLRFMHENAILRRKNADLSASEGGASSDALLARGDLLSRLQTLDNALVLTDTQQRTIDAQSEEMLSLHRELYDMGERVVGANRQVIELELMCSEYNRTIDVLQKEVSRVRRELMTSSASVNTRSSGILGTNGARNPANRIATAVTTGTFSGQDGPYAPSRRPHTQQGLSRERNRLRSEEGGDRGVDRGVDRGGGVGGGGLSGLSRSGAGSSLPSMSEAALRASIGSSSTSLSPPREYAYVDLQGRVEAGEDRAALSVGASLQTLRSDMLQDYDDKLGKSKTVEVGGGSGDLRRERAGSPIGAGEGLEDWREGSGKQTSMSLSSKQSQSLLSQSLSSKATPFRRKSLLVAEYDPEQSVRYDTEQGQGQGQAQGQRPSTTSTIGGGGEQFSMGQAIRGVQEAYGEGSGKGLKKCLSMPASPFARHTSPLGSDGGGTVRFAEEEGNHTHTHPNTNTHTHTPTGVFSPPASAGTDGGARRSGTADSTQGRPPPSHPQHPQPQHPHPHSQARSLQSKQRTLFVGMGLGLRHDAAVEAQLRGLNQGSSRQILDKILAKFDC